MVHKQKQITYNSSQPMSAKRNETGRYRHYYMLLIYHVRLRMKKEITLSSQLLQNSDVLVTHDTGHRSTQ